MPKLSFFQFFDKKAHITSQFFFYFWPDGKMADQLLQAMFSEFTLNFIKNEKFAPYSLR